MAIVILQRPCYREKSAVIQYVVSQRILVRARPEKVRNPRTRAQEANRSKMAVASRFLSALQPFVAVGFQGYTKQNGREVGAYHAALGRLLDTGMRRGISGWEIDHSKVILSEGPRVALPPITISRQGKSLILACGGPRRCAVSQLRLAVHCASRNTTICLRVEMPKPSGKVVVRLPKGTESSPLHLWWMPVGHGAVCWASTYVFLPFNVGSRTSSTSARGKNFISSRSDNPSSLCKEYPRIAVATPGSG